MRRWCGAVVTLLLMAPAVRAAIPDDRIYIGIITGGGPLGGQEAQHSAMVAAALATGDFGTAVGPIDVELHGTAPDTVGQGDSEQVRHWLGDAHFGLVVDAAGSPEDAQIAAMATAHHRVLAIAATGTDPAAATCGPTVLKWAESPAVLARATARVLAGEGRRHSFVIAGQEHGAELLRDLGDALPASGGSVVGSWMQVSGSPDFGRALQQAARTGADSLVLALAGPDLGRALRRVGEAGITGRMTVVAPGATRAALEEAGVNEAAGVLVVGGWNPEQGAVARNFAEHFRGRYDQRDPIARDATVYAAVYAYLEAAKQEQSLDSAAILTGLRRAPLSTLLGPVQVLANGEVARDVPVFRVRRPGEVQSAGEVLSPLAAIPWKQAYPACGSQ